MGLRVAHDGTCCKAGERSFAAVLVLVLWQTGALAINVLAICMSRRSAGDGPWFAVSAAAYGLTYASALWALTRPQLARAVRNTAVICLGVIPALQAPSERPRAVYGVRRATPYAHAE